MKKNQGNMQTLIECIYNDILNGDLSDIIEITYAYSKEGDKYINRTLFENFTGEKYIGNIEEVYGKTLNKLISKKEILEKYLNQLKSQKEIDDRTKILIGTLEYIDDIVELTITGLPFEGEKAGLKHGLDENEIHKLVLKLENIEVRLFDGNVRDNYSEMIESLKYLKNIYNENLSELIQEERTIYKGHLNTLEKYININFKEQPKQDKDSVIVQEENTNKKIKEKHGEQNNLLDMEIDRESYIKIFKIIFEIYNINLPIIIDERSSIYDGEDALRIPNSDAYKKLALKRILELIQHEIETHYITNKNNKKILGKFRGGKNLEKEEGLAVVMELLLSGYSLEDIGIHKSVPEIAMGEILSGENYKIFIHLLYKLKGDLNSNGVLLRRKRNYPYNYLGVQHKDITYNRGIKKVIEYIKTFNNAKSLFYGRVSFSDLEKIEKIISKENITLTYPLLIGEYIKFNLLNQNKTYEEFYNYIGKKYPFYKVQKIYELVNSKDIEKKINEIINLIKTKF